MLGPADKVQLEPVDRVPGDDLLHDRHPVVADFLDRVIQGGLVGAAVGLLDDVFRVVDGELRTEWVGGVERFVVRVAEPDRRQHFLAP